MDETPYIETLEPGGAGGSPDGAGGSKLPPVLANLMGSMGAGKSPQGPGGGGINVQEILTSIMVRVRLPPPSSAFLISTFSGICLSFYANTHLLTYPLICLSFLCQLLTLLSIHLASSQGSPNSHPSEELLKQPDYSDKIKQMLGNHQGQPWGLGGERLLWGVGSRVHTVVSQGYCC